MHQPLTALSLHFGVDIVVELSEFVDVLLVACNDRCVPTAAALTADGDAQPV